MSAAGHAPRGRRLPPNRFLVTTALDRAGALTPEQLRRGLDVLFPSPLAHAVAADPAAARAG